MFGKNIDGNTIQEILFDTMKKLQSKKIAPSVATALASQAREICRIAKVQLEYRKDDRNAVLVERISKGLPKKMGK